MDHMGRKRTVVRQEICSYTGDLAITESVDRDRHPLQHFEERGLSTALVLFECRSLGFNRLFPDGVLLIRGHQD